MAPSRLPSCPTASTPPTSPTRSGRSLSRSSRLHTAEGGPADGPPGASSTRCSTSSRAGSPRDPLANDAEGVPALADRLPLDAGLEARRHVAPPQRGAPLAGAGARGTGRPAERGQSRQPVRPDDGRRRARARLRRGEAALRPEAAHPRRHDGARPPRPRPQRGGTRPRRGEAPARRPALGGAPPPGGHLGRPGLRRAVRAVGGGGAAVAPGGGAWR